MKGNKFCTKEVCKEDRRLKVKKTKRRDPKLEDGYGGKRVNNIADRRAHPARHTAPRMSSQLALSDSSAPAAREW